MTSTAVTSPPSLMVGATSAPGPATSPPRVCGQAGYAASTCSNPTNDEEQAALLVCWAETD
jgi:hypothetical protein